MSEALLNLTITPFGADQLVTFKTFDDAITWLQGQQGKWAEFHRDADRYPPIRGHREAICYAIDSLSKMKSEKSREKAAATLHGLETPPFLDADGIGAELINEAVEAGQPDTAYIIYLLWTDKGAPSALRHQNLDIVRLLKAAALWRDKGGFGAGLIGLAAFLYWNFYSLIDHVSTKSANTTAIVLLALPALLYLTLVRVAHKSYRDEVRHEVDAEQRATLAKTYLALVKDDDGKIEPGERLLALHALFRGSSMSDSPDDTPPVNSLEAILQSLKPKS